MREGVLEAQGQGWQEGWLPLQHPQEGGKCQDAGPPEPGRSSCQKWGIPRHLEAVGGGKDTS